MSKEICASCNKPISGPAVVILDNVETTIRAFVPARHPACALPLLQPQVVEGWKGIAAAIGRSECAARMWAAREVDPLPVGALGGIMRASRAALEAWVARQAVRPARPTVVRRRAG